MNIFKAAMAESSTSQYKKILQAHGVNTRTYWLVEIIKNDCIVTWVGGYDEILPEPSGNPSGSALGIFLRLRQYFIINPSSRHNTVTILSNQSQNKMGRARYIEPAGTLYFIHCNHILFCLPQCGNLYNSNPINFVSNVSSRKIYFWKNY